MFGKLIQLGTTEAGSIAEWQQFFKAGAKLPGRFRDRAPARLMGGDPSAPRQRLALRHPATIEV
jgi:hypothetical protein